MTTENSQAQTGIVPAPNAGATATQVAEANQNLQVEVQPPPLADPQQAVIVDADALNARVIAAESAVTTANQKYETLKSDYAGQSRAITTITQQRDAATRQLDSEYGQAQAEVYAQALDGAIEPGGVQKALANLKQDFAPKYGQVDTTFNAQQGDMVRNTIFERMTSAGLNPTDMLNPTVQQIRTVYNEALNAGDVQAVLPKINEIIQTAQSGLPVAPAPQGAPQTEEQTRARLLADPEFLRQATAQQREAVKRSPAMVMPTGGGNLPMQAAPQSAKGMMSSGFAELEKAKGQA